MTSVHEIALQVWINDPSSLGVKVFHVFLDVEDTPGHERSLKRRPSYYFKKIMGKQQQKVVSNGHLPPHKFVACGS